MKETHSFLCDQLIRVLVTKNNITDMRKIIINSQLWPIISEAVFLRIEKLTAKQNPDTDYSIKLRTMGKTLANIDAELKLHTKIVKDFRSSIPSEHFALLIKYMDHLNEPFFEHIESLATIARRKGLQSEDDSLKILSTKITAMVNSYNYTINDKKKIQSALLKLQTLLNSTSSIDDAEKKIDEMALSCQLDPSFLIVISRVYSSIKESPYANSEIADVAMHLYFRTQGQINKNMPREVRILKHLLCLNDPLIFKSELDRALNPGPDVETKTSEYMYTKPDRLLLTVNTILKAHENHHNLEINKKRNWSFKPNVINRIIMVRKMLISNYMN